MQSQNLAARAGRWSAGIARPRSSAGWRSSSLATVLGGPVGGQKTLADEDYGQRVLRVADKAIANAGFPRLAPTSRCSSRARARSRSATPRSRRRSRTRSRALEATSTSQRSSPRSPRATRASSPRTAAPRSSRSRSPGDDDVAKERVDATLAATAAAQKANPRLRIEQFGDASADKAIKKAFEDDFKKAEFLSLPITLIILIVAFGALVAAGVPLLLGAHRRDRHDRAARRRSASSSRSTSRSPRWSCSIGLAVGVDYSMFYLRREREERAAGRVARRPRSRPPPRPPGRAVLDLRPHRDGRHGRHVLRRQRRLQLVRHRHDPRRRASPCSAR